MLTISPCVIAAVEHKKPKEKRSPLADCIMSIRIFYVADLLIAFSFVSLNFNPLEITSLLGNASEIAKCWADSEKGEKTRVVSAVLPWNLDICNKAKE